MEDNNMTWSDLSLLLLAEERVYIFQTPWYLNLGVILQIWGQESSP